MSALDLTRLPRRTEVDFGPRVRRLDATLVNAEAEYRATLLDPGATRDQRFACLYALLHRLRREYRYSEYQDLLRKYEAEFGNDPYFDTFRVVEARWTGEDARSVRAALERSERAVSQISTDPGVLHQYSELVATLGEARDGASTKYLPKAFERVDKAIEMAPGHQAIYFATRARLHLIADELEAAREDIEQAITNEDIRSPDYARRISRFEATRLRILLRQQQQTFESRQRAVMAELDNFKSQQLGLLSLLAALIALLAITASISTRIDPVDAIGLIMAAGGVVTIAFGGVAAALAGGRPLRVTVVLLVGTALLAAAAAWQMTSGLNLAVP